MNLRTLKLIWDQLNKSIKQRVNQNNITQRNNEIALERGLTEKELLEYDVSYSLLFDYDGVMTKLNMSLLLKKLESYFTLDD